MSRSGGMTRRQRGFALLIVLWSAGFLALLGSQMVAAGRSDTRVADGMKQEAELEAVANGAVQDVVFQMLAAKNPDYQPDGMVRRLEVGRTTVLVRIENETDRINLNTASAALLRSLIIELGAQPNVADGLAAAILDWRTSGLRPRPGGAKAPEYASAGRDYGPPGAPFQSVAELADVLGITPNLFAAMAPHLTVLTDGDPDMSTRDPLVALALTDAAGIADATDESKQGPDALLRITVTAIGAGRARYSLTVVAAADFSGTVPRVNILLRQREAAS